jgi:RNA recognition motif-containing protein
LQGWTVFITGINEEVIEDDMMDKLQEYGKVLNMHLNLGNENHSILSYYSRI